MIPMLEPAGLTPLELAYLHGEERDPIVACLLDLQAKGCKNVGFPCRWAKVKRKHPPKTVAWLGHQDAPRGSLRVYPRALDGSSFYVFDLKAILDWTRKKAPVIFGVPGVHDIATAEAVPDPTTLILETP